MPNQTSQTREAESNYSTLRRESNDIADISSEQASTENVSIEGKSVGELAKPYLLAVAKMPISVLDISWSIGKNRCINRAHVQKLKQVFKKMGVERHAQEHRLRLLCSADDTKQMLNNNNNSKDCKDFLHWGEIHQGKVEVMAGQHRIQALCNYVKEAKLPESELWWICELYDRGIYRIFLQIVNNKLNIYRQSTL